MCITWFQSAMNGKDCLVLTCLSPWAPSFELADTLSAGVTNFVSQKLIKNKIFAQSALLQTKIGWKLSHKKEQSDVRSRSSSSRGIISFTQIEKLLCWSDASHNLQRAKNAENGSACRRTPKKYFRQQPPLLISVRLRMVTIDENVICNTVLIFCRWSAWN